MSLCSTRPRKPESVYKALSNCPIGVQQVGALGQHESTCSPVYRLHFTPLFVLSPLSKPLIGAGSLSWLQIYTLSAPGLTWLSSAMKSRSCSSHDQVPYSWQLHLPSLGGHGGSLPVQGGSAWVPHTRSLFPGREFDWAGVKYALGDWADFKLWVYR